MYAEALSDHFHHPRNVGKLEGADTVGTAGVPYCGPFMVLSLRVFGGRIADAKFQTYGCPVAIACGSFVAESVVGMAVSDALQLTAQDVSEGLGGVPLGKEHCPRLAVDALRDAVSRFAEGDGSSR
jgi:NifU-like protein involved in Fe-S cluster formation